MTTTSTPPRTFGRSRAVPTDTPSPARRGGGWGAAKATSDSIGTGDLFFKVDETKKIIAFVNEEPFDWNSAHWLEHITEGSKAVICWDSLLDDDRNYIMPERCPICREGDDPSKLSVFFNVISLENPDSPALRVWEVGKLAFKALEEFAVDPKTSPLNKDGLYFEVSKAKDVKVPKIVPVKGRDLLEDYGIAPLPPEAISDLAKNQKTGPVKEPLALEKMREHADKLL